jgi:hypothetical protein
MNLDLSDLLKCVGFAASIVVAGVVLEVLLRTIFARFGAPAINDAPTELGPSNRASCIIRRLGMPPAETSRCTVLSSFPSTALLQPSMLCRGHSALRSKTASPCISYGSMSRL